MNSPMRLWPLLALAACAAPPAPSPAVLAPATNATTALVTGARGVQIYECRTKADGFEWAFVAPRADLLDAAGRVVGSHGAGPFWQAADGSRIVGRVTARADAPHAGAIPWLLLDARSDGAAGVLAKVTQVQRLNTEGGLAPAAGCNLERLGQRVNVPYRADYRVFVSTSSSL
jgi:hypothetical protein